MHQLSVYRICMKWLFTKSTTTLPSTIIFLPHVNRHLERRIFKLCTSCDHNIIIRAFLMQFQHYMFLQHKECVKFLGHLKAERKRKQSVTQNLFSSNHIMHNSLRPFSTQIPMMNTHHFVVMADFLVTYYADRHLAVRDNVLHIL